MSLTRVLPSWAGALLNFLPMLENQKLTKFQRVSRNLAVGIMERASNDQDKAGNDVVGLLLGITISYLPTTNSDKPSSEPKLTRPDEKNVGDRDPCSDVVRI